MKKTYLIAILSLVLLTPGATVHAQISDKVQLTLDKRIVKTEAFPYKLIGETIANKEKEKPPLSLYAVLKNNHVMGPLRFIAELSGVLISWNSEKYADIIRLEREESKSDTKNTTVINLDHVSYTLPIISEKFKKYSFATKTNAGIVWAPAPERAKSNDSSVYYPATPYILYLSNPNVHYLNVKQSEKLIELQSGENDVFQNLRTIHGVGDYLVYHTTLNGEGMAQGFKSQAWVMKVNEPQSKKEMESFHILIHSELMYKMNCIYH